MGNWFTHKAKVHYKLAPVKEFRFSLFVAKINCQKSAKCKFHWVKMHVKYLNFDQISDMMILSYICLTLKDSISVFIFWLSRWKLIIRIFLLKSVSLKSWQWFLPKSSDRSFVQTKMSRDSFYLYVWIWLHTSVIGLH